MNLYKVYLKKMNQLGGRTQKNYVLAQDMRSVCSAYPKAAKIKEVVRDVEELEPLKPETLNFITFNFQHYNILTFNFMTPLTIYIAGKVSGEPIADCTLKFGTAQKQVQELGHTAINPLEVVNDWHATWEVAMRKCVKSLMDADAILLLHDHRNSPGASLEGQLAATFKMPVFYSIKELRNYRSKTTTQTIKKQ